MGPVCIWDREPPMLPHWHTSWWLRGYVYQLKTTPCTVHNCCRCYRSSTTITLSPTHPACDQEPTQQGALAGTRKAQCCVQVCPQTNRPPQSLQETGTINNQEPSGKYRERNPAKAPPYVVACLPMLPLLPYWIRTGLIALPNSQRRLIGHKHASRDAPVGKKQNQNAHQVKHIIQMPCHWQLMHGKKEWQPMSGESRSQPPLW